MHGTEAGSYQSRIVQPTPRKSLFVLVTIVSIIRKARHSEIQRNRKKPQTLSSKDISDTIEKRQAPVLLPARPQEWQFRCWSCACECNARAALPPPQLLSRRDPSRQQRGGAAAPPPLGTGAAASPPPPAAAPGPGSAGRRVTTLTPAAPREGHKTHTNTPLPAEQPARAGRARRPPPQERSRERAPPSARG